MKEISSESYRVINTSVIVLEAVAAGLRVMRKNVGEGIPYLLEDECDAFFVLDGDDAAMTKTITC